MENNCCVLLAAGAERTPHSTRDPVPVSEPTPHPAVFHVKHRSFMRIISKT